MTPTAPRLVLASGSPRRTDVLDRLGLPHAVEPPAVEEAVRRGEAPAPTAERLARRKAETAVREGVLALGCDTLLSHGDETLGKPRSAAEAREMLERLSGEIHVVHSGIALAEPGRTESTVKHTRVRFRVLSRDEIDEYVATGEPLDKAGAYAVQALGASLVEAIEGDFYNVMGLPVPALLELLRRLGWRYAFGELKPLS